MFQLSTPVGHQNLDHAVILDPKAFLDSVDKMVNKENKDPKVTPVTLERLDLQDNKAIRGVSATYKQLIIDVDRTNMPWIDNNKITVPNDGVLLFNLTFSVEAITGSLNGGGWVDIKVGSDVYCLQRKANTKRFEFIYKKLAAAITGCDSNSDKDLNAVLNPNLLTLSVAQDTVLQVIPREPSCKVLSFHLYSIYLLLSKTSGRRVQCSIAFPRKDCTYCYMYKFTSGGIAILANSLYM